MNILVLCTGNSARSVLLEAILNKIGEGRLKAWSAGSAPTGAIHPHTLRLLQAAGYETAGLRSKSWDEFAAPGAPEMDAVITVCGAARDETCPYWPGAPLRAHWGVEDPAAFSGKQAEVDRAFATAYRLLLARGKAFVRGYSPDISKSELAVLLSSAGRVEV